MGIVLQILGCLIAIGGLVCTIIILIDAFQDEIWKGLVSILCGFYFLWYALFEFEHDKKWLIVAGSLFGNLIGGGLIALGGGGS